MRHCVRKQQNVLIYNLSCVKKLFSKEPVEIFNKMY